MSDDNLELVRGSGANLSRFAIDRLMMMLPKLGQDIEVNPSS